MKEGHTAQAKQSCLPTRFSEYEYDASVDAPCISTLFVNARDLPRYDHLTAGRTRLCIPVRTPPKKRAHREIHSVDVENFAVPDLIYFVGAAKPPTVEIFRAAFVMNVRRPE